LSRENGCQIFLDTIYQNVGECTKLQLNKQNGRNMYQMSVCNIFQMAIKYSNIFPFLGSQKSTQIGIFCLKMYHLATLLKSIPIRRQFKGKLCLQDHCDKKGDAANLELKGWLKKTILSLIVFNDFTFEIFHFIL
jgi:hypothetical protein